MRQERPRKDGNEPCHVLQAPALSRFLVAASATALRLSTIRSLALRDFGENPVAIRKVQVDRPYATSARIPTPLKQQRASLILPPISQISRLSQSARRRIRAFLSMTRRPPRIQRRS